jgi:hypothetical protein
MTASRPAIPPVSRPPIILYLTWLILIGAAVGGFLSEAFSITFVAAGTCCCRWFRSGWGRRSA